MGVDRMTDIARDVRTPAPYGRLNCSHVHMSVTMECARYVCYGIAPAGVSVQNYTSVARDFCDFGHSLLLCPPWKNADLRDVRHLPRRFCYLIDAV
jgi:hypothetical protein